MLGEGFLISLSRLGWCSIKNIKLVALWEKVIPLPASTYTFTVLIVWIRYRCYRCLCGSDKQISWTTFPRIFSLCELVDFLTYLGAISSYNKLRMYDVLFSEQIDKFEPTTHGRTSVVLSLLYVNPPHSNNVYASKTATVSLAGFWLTCFFSFLAVYRLQEYAFSRVQRRRKDEALPCKFPRQFP